MRLRRLHVDTVREASLLFRFQVSDIERAELPLEELGVFDIAIVGISEFFKQGILGSYH